MSGLAAVDHIVVLMLENRSFDHMLGYLYSDGGNMSPAGDPYAGLTGSESCPGSDGKPVQVYRLTPETPDVYFYPGADPARATRRPTASATDRPAHPPPAQWHR